MANGSPEAMKRQEQEGDALADAWMKETGFQSSENFKHLTRERFAEVTSDPESIRRMHALIAEMQKDLEEAYRKKGYTVAELNKLNDQGKLAHFRNVQRRIKEFEPFLKNLQVMAQGGRVRLKEDVVNARHPQWLSLFSEYQELIDDVNALSSEKGEKEKKSADTPAPEESVTQDASADADTVSEKAPPTEATAPKQEDAKQETVVEQAAPEKGNEDERTAFLDSIQGDIAKEIPNAFGITTPTEYTKIGELANDAKQLLASISSEDNESYGMYGHLNDHEEVNKKVDAIIAEIKDLKSQLLDTYGDGSPSKETSDSPKTKTEEVKEVPQPEQPPASEVSPAGKERSPEEIEARKAWAEARKESNAAEKAYQDAVADYYKAMDKKSLLNFGRMRHQFRSAFGLAPKFPDEINKLHEKTVESRRAYMQQGEALMQARAYRAGSDESAVKKRYERMLGHHLLMEPIRQRGEIQQIAMKELYPKGTATRRVMETLHKYRHLKTAGRIAVYGAIGFATGGIGAAVLAGGRVGIGVAAGGFLGARIGKDAENFLNKNYVGKREREFAEVADAAKTSLFTRNFAANEARVRAQAERVERAKQMSKIGSRSAAAAAGFAVGGGAASFIDIPDTPDTPGIAPEPPVEAPEMQIPRPEIETPPEHLPRFEFTEPTIPEGALYVVEEGDNVWDIMEERYAEMLDALPNEQAREEFLDTIKDRLAVDESLRGEVGLGPNINLIHPGDQLNMTPLDSYAQGLMEQHAIEHGAGAGEAPAPAEVIPDAANIHAVEPDENLWNIMEGDGPDANPVGGESEVARGMERLERNKALITLVEYLRENPDFAREAGISSGDPDRIFPPNPETGFEGGKINVTMLDAKLRELLGIEAPAAEVPAPETPAESPSGAPAEDAPRRVPVTPGDRWISPEGFRYASYDGGGVPEVQHVGMEASVPPLEVSPALMSMSIDEIYDLWSASRNGNTAALEGTGIPVEELNRAMNWIHDNNRVQLESLFPDNPGGIPLDQYIELQKNPPGTSAEGAPDPNSLLEHPEEHEAPIEHAAVVKEFVDSIEAKPEGFISSFLGSENPAAGTFATLENVTMKEIFDLTEMDETERTAELAERGIPEEGFNKWAEWIRKEGLDRYGVEVNFDSTFGEYVDAVGEAKTNQTLSV